MWTLPIQWRASTLTTEVFQINEPGRGVAGGWESEGGCKAAFWAMATGRSARRETRCVATSWKTSAA